MYFFMSKRKNEAIWINSRQRWQINVQNDGTRKTFTCSIPGKKGKIGAERKADKWLQCKTQDDNIRLEKAWSEFLQEAETVLGNYRQLEQMGRLWILPKHKHKKIKDITIQDWQDCINDAYKKGKSKKTCQNIRGAITSFYGYAKKRRLPMEKPELLVIPKDAPVKERKILQPEDIKKLFTIDYVTIRGKKEKCFFIYAWRFDLLNGLRRGELCGLQNTDFDGRILHINRSVNSDNEITPGKNKNARRYMALSKLSLQVLAEQRKMLKELGIISPWVFPDECGDMLKPHHLYKKWAYYSKQHGINCSLHEMRHTMISVAKADVPEQLLKQAVGHSNSMDTFGVYGHRLEGEAARVADILDNVFNAILQ